MPQGEPQVEPKRMHRRVWLSAFGGVLASHFVGCAAPRRPPAARLPELALPHVEVAEPSAEALAPGPVETERAEEEPLPPPKRELALPPRPKGAESGSAFLARIEGMGRGASDDAIFEAITSGNIPGFLRPLVAVVIGPAERPRAKLFVTCDYLAIGSDEDFIRMPMTAAGAQRIADLCDATLPTVRMVDLIYEHASAKLPPSYIEGGPTDGTFDDYAEHHQKLERRRLRAGLPLGALTAGHKKDIVLSCRLFDNRDRVAIYGWHRAADDVIQPLSTRHYRRYADYSHGVRLVAQSMELGGERRRVTDVLVNRQLCELLSDEGPLTITSYPTTLPAYEGPVAKKSDKKKKKKPAKKLG